MTDHREGLFPYFLKFFIYFCKVGYLFDIYRFLVEKISSSYTVIICNSRLEPDIFGPFDDGMVASGVY